MSFNIDSLAFQVWEDVRMFLSHCPNASLRTVSDAVLTPIITANEVTEWRDRDVLRKEVGKAYAANTKGKEQRHGQQSRAR